MVGMFMPGVSESVLLVALGLGYIVCYLADREEGTLRKLGFAIGGFIIALSLILILNTLLLTFKFSKNTHIGNIVPSPQMQFPLPR